LSIIAIAEPILGSGLFAIGSSLIKIFCHYWFSMLYEKIEFEYPPFSFTCLNPPNIRI